MWRWWHSLQRLLKILGLVYLAACFTFALANEVFDFGFHKKRPGSGWTAEECIHRLPDEAENCLLIKEMLDD